MTDYEAILRYAHTTAKRALETEARDRPENPHAFDCGFAWVTIDGNHPLARWCRKNAHKDGSRRYYGDKGYPRGWQWWKPGSDEFPGQSIRIFEAGARAFRDALAEHNIVGTVGSRLD